MPPLFWFLIVLTAMVTGVSLARRRRPLAGISFAVLSIAVFALLASLGLPVTPTAAPGAVPTDLIYVGVTDPELFQEVARRLPDSRSAVFVGPPASRDVVEQYAPGHGFREVQASADDPGSLASALADLPGQLGLLRDGGRVIFLVPRSDAVARDAATLKSLMLRSPWLRDRLFRAIPGEGLLRMLPPLPDLRVEAPAVVSPGSGDYPVLVSVQSAEGVTTRIEGRLAGDHSAGLRLDATTAAVRVETNDLTKSKLVGSLTCRGRLPAPGPGRATTACWTIRAPGGEPLAAAQRTTLCLPPVAGVLVPPGSDESKSPLLSLFRQLGLPAQAVRVDLSGKNVQDGVRLVRPFGVLFIDGELSADQGRALLAVLDTAGGAAPVPVFTGSAGRDALPPGWTTVLHKLRFAPVPGRKIGLATDLSGSMYSAEPQYGGRTRLQIAYHVAKKLHDGLKQRNVNQMLLPVRSGRPCSLADYSAGGNDGYWEGGSHLTCFRTLAQQEPLSDLILFWDATDVTGGESSSDFALLSNNQLQAAAQLEQQGIRLHIIAIGGDLHPGNGKFVCSGQRVKFGEPKTFDDFMRAVQTQVFEFALPRLRVSLEARNVGLLPADRVEPLRRAVHNPDLKLINILGRYENKKTAATVADVLLWVDHFSPQRREEGMPLLVRTTYPTSGGSGEAYFFPLDIGAELAQTPSQASKRRDALSDLFIAVVGAVSGDRELKEAPVAWEMDGSGVLTAQRRDRRPFHLGANGLVGRTLPGPEDRPGAAATVRLLRLTRPEFHFVGLTPDVPRTVEGVVVEEDREIGRQTMRAALFGMPATPVRGPDRDLFGQPWTDQELTEHETEGAQLPGWLFRGMVVLLWLVLAGYVLRG